jgi:disulfide bond formation protein DsbB|tara:strand:+ start:196 stop:684 length:489 start_codon:yes stop_codon:yes gene_type:complete
MLSTQNKFVLRCILFFSIFALCLAYFVQYVLDHQPCNLCVIERIPYFSAVILITLIFILNKYEKIISLVITLFFIFGIIISFYHVGIEQGFFSESLVCELGGIKSNNMSADELLEELGKKNVSCKDVTFTILGFSLATFNTILSLVLSVIMIKNIKKYGKNK